MVGGDYITTDADTGLVHGVEVYQASSLQSESAILLLQVVSVSLS